MTLRELRAYFPHTADTIYLNHAATSPLSRPVMDAMQGYLNQRHGAEGASHIDNFAAFQHTVEDARSRAARVLGAEPSCVEFVQNTSTALNLLAHGLDWQPGDRIALPGCEFPANVYPFMNLGRQGVAVDLIPHDRGTVSLDAIEAALTPDTRLLTISWVQFLSGFRADLNAIGELCEAHDVLFCVDAIQGLGALQIDVEAYGIDFLACGGHKWLMATQGIGLLYCAPHLMERLAPPAGWLHGPVDWDNFFDYRLDFYDDARQFRLGTSNHVGIAALHAALGVYLDAGPAWCEERVLERAQDMADALAARGYARYGTDDPAHASGIVTVEADDPDALFGHLHEHGIVAALRNRMLRFAPTYYNTTDEVEAVMDVVDAFGTIQVATSA